MKHQYAFNKQEKTSSQTELSTRNLTHLRCQQLAHRISSPNSEPLSNKHLLQRYLNWQAYNQQWLEKAPKSHRLRSGVISQLERYAEMIVYLRSQVALEQPRGKTRN